MTTFSFRAECKADVEKVLMQIELLTEDIKLKMFPDKGGMPDVDVELTVNMEERDILSMMVGVEDGYVMYQTLRAVPLAQNSLERDMSREWPCA